MKPPTAVPSPAGCSPEPSSRPPTRPGTTSLAALAAALGLALGLGLPPGPLATVHAQSVGGSYQLLGQTTGGGGASAGGTWSLTGSVAVPICAVSSGGSYVLNGGLVGAYVVPTGPIVIGIERADTGVRLTFDGVLESAPTPAGPWAEVAGAASPHEVAAGDAARFFRARQ